MKGNATPQRCDFMTLVGAVPSSASASPLPKCSEGRTVSAIERCDIMILVGAAPCEASACPLS